MTDLQNLLVKLDDLWDYCDRLKLLYPGKECFFHSVQTLIEFAENIIINTLGVNPE